MKMRRAACMLVAIIMMLAMTATDASAASFKSKPTGVKAKCVSGVSVQVSCKAKKGAKGYYFYYAKSKNGKYKLGAKSKKRKATIKGLTAGKTYYFKVKAYKGKVLKTFTKFSKPVKCKTVLKAPAFSVSPECCCKMNLKMTKPAGAKGFLIYRSTSSGSIGKQVAKTTSTTWQDTGLKAQTRYFYRVRVYKGSYSSPFSGAKGAATMASLGDGNGSKYDLDHCGTSNYASALKGRNIFFLGSSITYGNKAQGLSFVDYIAARNGLSGIRCVDGAGNNRVTPNAGNGVVWKEAVCGKTLARVKGDLQTYSFRMHRNYENTDINPDVVVCQLSLNDALQNIPTGKMQSIQFAKLQNKATADSYLTQLYKNSFNVAGAIEYVTAYAYAKWPECQVMFYTVSYFKGGKSANYEKMVTLLHQEAKTNHIAVLDLWNNSAIRAWKGPYFCLYMADSHHPKRAGYLQWTPYFEKALAACMPKARDYEITWKNEDGAVLETDCLARGTLLSYDGADPEKEADGDKTYQFIGWKDEASGRSYSPDQIANMIVLRDTTFVAQFEEVGGEESGQDPVPGDGPGEGGTDGQGAGDGQGTNGGDGAGGSDGTGTDGDSGADEGDGNSGGGTDGDGTNSNPDDTAGILQWLGIAA